MADETKTNAASATAEDVGVQKAGSPIVPLVLAILAAVVVSVGAMGAAAFWMVKSGRLVSGGPAKVVAAEKANTIKTKLIALDPLLVNLADADGKAYLRVTIVLKVEDSPPVKGEKPKEEEKPDKGKVPVNETEVMMRDAALGVIGCQTGDALLAADGKEQLKAKLRDALGARLPNLKVMDVLLTEFLVQR